MRVQITQRHCEVPEPIRDHAEERITRLKKYDVRLSAAEVIFTEEKNERKVEAILTIDGGKPVVAQAEGRQFREAIDRLTERLAKILRRQRAQVVDHQPSGVPD